MDSLDQETALQVVGALPMPVLIVGPDQAVLFVNPAAEQFFDMGAGRLTKQRLGDLVPFGSPILPLIAQAKDRRASVGERDMDLSTPRHGERVADVAVTPLAGSDGAIMLPLQERSFAQRLDR